MSMKIEVTVNCFYIFYSFKEYLISCPCLVAPIAKRSPLGENSISLDKTKGSASVATVPYESTLSSLENNPLR